jgi:hypothetical protein
MVWPDLNIIDQVATSHRRLTSWFCPWFWHNRCHGPSQCAERHSPPENIQNGRCSGGQMPLISTLVGRMASVFWWRIIENHGVVVVTLFWLSWPSVRFFTVLCGYIEKSKICLLYHRFQRRCGKWRISCVSSNEKTGKQQIEVYWRQGEEGCVSHQNTHMRTGGKIGKGRLKFTRRWLKLLDKVKIFASEISRNFCQWWKIFETCI